MVGRSHERSEWWVPLKSVRRATDQADTGMSPRIPGEDMRVFQNIIRRLIFVLLSVL